MRTNEVIAEPVLTTTFTTYHDFELGGRRFELYSVPGGETLDSLFVWLPEERTVFTGNYLGPIFGTIPNLYTIRGDRLRSAVAKAEAEKRGISVDEMLAERAKLNPAGRFGEPEEFGLACAFLCGAKAGFITGQNILLDGGAFPGTL